MSLSCVVEYPCLASPGPSGTILSQLGVLACVLGFCLQGFVSIASIELLAASLPELLKQHGACRVVLYSGVGYEVELAQQFSSCRERLQPDCRSECVAVVEVARLNSENVASEKKRKSLKLSCDGLHAVT